MKLGFCILVEEAKNAGNSKIDWFQRQTKYISVRKKWTRNETKAIMWQSLSKIGTVGLTHDSLIGSILPRARIAHAEIIPLNVTILITP